MGVLMVLGIGVYLREFALLFVLRFNVWRCGRCFFVCFEVCFVLVIKYCLVLAIVLLGYRRCVVQIYMLFMSGLSLACECIMWRVTRCTFVDCWVCNVVW